jgi:hypothetical protein
MEPRGIPSVALQDTLEKHFAMSPDFAMLAVSSPREAYMMSKKVRALSTVAMVESISNYLPPRDLQEKRAPLATKFRERVRQWVPPEDYREKDLESITAELERLDANIYELGQMAFLGGQDRVERYCRSLTGDPEDPQARGRILQLAERLEKDLGKAVAALNRMQALTYPYLKQNLLHMSSPELWNLEDLPESIRSRFENQARDRFLVTIYPSNKVWDFAFMKRFSRQLRRVDPRITGTPLLFEALMNYVKRDGTKSTLLAVVVIFVVLVLDFRRWAPALAAMLPLLAGALWMVGLLHVSGLMLTFVNVMAIPMIVGIGIDDGVHLIHRYRAEGFQRVDRVLGSTGKAILLTTLTTMAGFGSLMIARYRGFFSLGSLLVIGVGAVFLATVILLPPIMIRLKK